VKIAITGGAGLIGSHISEQLLREGHEITIIDNLSRGKFENVSPLINTYNGKIKFINDDLVDYAAAKKNLVGIDSVFHLAAIVGGVKLAETSRSAIIPTIDCNVARACVENDVAHVLYTSTACAYPVSTQTSSCVGVKMTETMMEMPAEPENLYGWAKLYGELMFKKFHEIHGLGLTIVRDFNVYGPKEDNDPVMSHVIPMLIRRALEKSNVPLTVWGSGNQYRSFMYADDAAQGMIGAFKQIKDGSPVNLGSEEAITIRELAKTILVACNRRPDDIVFDRDQPEGVFWRCPDTTRARTLLNWKPETSLEEGINRAVAYYRTHPQ